MYVTQGVFTLLYAYKDMIFKEFQSALHNLRRREDAILEKKEVRSLKNTQKTNVHQIVFC